MGAVAQACVACNHARDATAALDGMMHLSCGIIVVQTMRDRAVEKRWQRQSRMARQAADREQCGHDRPSADVVSCRVQTCLLGPHRRKPKDGGCSFTVRLHLFHLKPRLVGQPPSQEILQTSVGGEPLNSKGKQKKQCMVLVEAGVKPHRMELADGCPQ